MNDDMDMLDDEFDFDEDMLGDLAYTTAAFSLTVSESKRLIARGVAADERVEAAMEEGVVAVCKGTTNAYVLEELLGRDVEKGKYVLGRTVPEGDKEAQKAFKGDIPEVVFRNGDPVEGLTVADAVKEMSAGDVVLKGANALDHASGVAAVLIGHPEGGTTAAIIGCVYGKGLHLIIPVGLEKQIATPMPLSATVASPAICAGSGIPRLWPLHGSLFTEIEALDVLAEVQAVQIAAGGVCGAEGAVWLMILGLEEDVRDAQALIEDMRGEPSFWDAVMAK